MPQNDSNEGPVGGNVPEPAAPQGLTTKVEEYSLANPEASYQQVATATGLPVSTVQEYFEQKKESPSWLSSQRVKQADLAEDYAKLARASAHAITDDKLEKATVRDLAVVSGIATDKHLLLTGQSTVIFGVEDRRKLHELLPALQAEIKRRGLAFEGEFKDVTPSPDTPSNTGKPETG